MTQGQYIKMLILLIVLLLHTKNSKAGHLDIGSQSETLSISARMQAEGFAISAESGKVDKIGAAFSMQQQGIELYIGANYTELKEYEAYTALNYKLNRFIYDAQINIYDGSETIELGFSYLITEDFGFTFNHELSTSKFFIGVRKWIR